jgi:MarR family transcriptional regulator, organic hydroperoxide resistance regulator
MFRTQNFRALNKPLPSVLPAELKSDLDAIVEAILYLYTEGRRLTKEIAARHGLTGPQLTVVKMLEALGDLPLSRLSEKIRAQNSTVTGIVDRMEREGLVVRTRSATDRRVVHIKLTPKGVKLARDVKVEPMVVFREALSALSPDETRDLLRILMKVASQVKKLVETA